LVKAKRLSSIQTRSAWRNSETSWFSRVKRTWPERRNERHSQACFKRSISRISQSFRHPRKPVYSKESVTIMAVWSWRIILMRLAQQRKSHFASRADKDRWYLDKSTNLTIHGSSITTSTTFSHRQYHRITLYRRPRLRVGQLMITTKT
jgi:hypothetical protein